MQYTVESGDSVSTIARDILNDIQRWPEIATLNKLAQPYTIYPGQVLQLPDPGTIQYGTATIVPAPPGAATAWWKNPWLWGAVGVLAWYFSQQTTKRKRGAGH